MFQKIDTWHKTKLGHACFAALEFGISYAFASLAIDRGNTLYYLLAILFLAGGVQNIIKIIVPVKKGTHGK